MIVEQRPVSTCKKIGTKCKNLQMSRFFMSVQELWKGSKYDDMGHSYSKWPKC